MKLSDKDSKTIVSNNIENEWYVLFLKITTKKNKIKVTVAKETNVSQVLRKYYIYDCYITSSYNWSSDLVKLVAYTQLAVDLYSLYTESCTYACTYV